MSDVEEEIERSRQMLEEVREFQGKMTARRYARMLEQFGRDPAFTLLPFTSDRYDTMTIGEWGGYTLKICSMGFNDCIVMTPFASPETYDHGWCYDKGGLAFVALIAWDPATEAEPPGYKKRATRGQRRPGETAVGWQWGVPPSARDQGRSVDAVAPE